MVANEKFFHQRKAAAILKHGILSRYLRPFAMKTGSTSIGGRVVILDGYAGEGRYEDGTPGSPIHMARTAADLAPARVVDLVLIEKNRAKHAALLRALSDEGFNLTHQPVRGGVNDHLDEVLGIAMGVPLFAFLDPYGRGLEFDDLVTKIYGRPNFQYAPATEVLMNFSAGAVRRIGGYLRSPKSFAGKTKTLEGMDRFCGGDWWRQAYLDAGSPERATTVIATEYQSRIHRATGCGGWLIPVHNAEGLQPVYHLLYLTRHPDGIWNFGEAVSGAQEEWRRAVIQPGTLFDDDDAFRTSEQALEEKWVREIKRNIKALLASRSRFIVERHYSVVFGTATGDAREKHLRRAIKELYREGSTGFNGAGRLQTAAVTRP